MNLAIIVGTRPEIIRLSSTIKLAKKYFKVTLIHTGQNYSYNLNDVFFEDLGLDKPDHYLDCVKDNIGSTIGDIIKKTFDLFQKIKPDAILILGDTNSCLCAYSAKRLKIPIFHIEAGNRCFDSNVPEEINRKIIDHISDINICYMEHARMNLLNEGLKIQYTFVVGSPMLEVLESIKDKIINSNIIKDLSLNIKQYFIFSSHREENIDNEKNFNNIIECINQLAVTYNKKVVFSVHPRTKKKIIEKGIYFNNNVILSDPFGLIDYCNLQMNSLCVISDSGTLTEESSILKFPAILLRNSTEHPEGIDAGNIIIGNIKWDNLKTSIDIMLQKKHWNDIDSYNVSDFSYKICNIISSYTEIVNKFIWMKN